MSIEKEIERIINEKFLSFNAFHKDETTKLVKKFEAIYEEIKAIDYQNLLEKTEELSNKIELKAEFLATCEEKILFLMKFAAQIKSVCDSLGDSD